MTKLAPLPRLCFRLPSFSFSLDSREMLCSFNFSTTGRWWKVEWGRCGQSIFDRTHLSRFLGRCGQSIFDAFSGRVSSTKVSAVQLLIFPYVVVFSASVPKVPRVITSRVTTADGFVLELPLKRFALVVDDLSPCGTPSELGMLNSEVTCWSRPFDE